MLCPSLERNSNPTREKCTTFLRIMSNQVLDVEILTFSDYHLQRQAILIKRKR